MNTILRNIAYVVSLVILMIVQSIGAQESKIEGVWKIEEVKFYGANPRTIANPQPSLLIFTKKHYSWQAIAGEKPQPDLPLNSDDVTDDQILAIFKAYSSRGGVYEIDASTITLRAVVAQRPFFMSSKWPLTTLDYKFEGNNTLIIDDRSMGRQGPKKFKLIRLE